MTYSAQERPEVSIVLPCYNEEKCLRNTARAILQAFANHRLRLELVMVDNGSRDGTVEIIDELIAAGLPVVKVVVPVNQGYGHGILEGLKRCRSPFVGYLCADGQVSAEDVVRIYRLVQGTDGRLLAKVRRRFRKDGLIRKISSIGYNSLMLLVFGRLEAIDINGSPKIFSREVYKAMQLESRDWFLDAEIVIKAKRLGLTVLELNVRGLSRQGGKSNVRLQTCLEFAKNIARHRFLRPFFVGSPAPSAAAGGGAEEVSPAPAAQVTAAHSGGGKAASDGALEGIVVLEQPRFEDARGFLQKILLSSRWSGAQQGEVYVTSASSGEAKGNHFHQQMGEWFAVVQGEGSIEVCDPESGERRSIPLGVSRPRTVFIPAGVAHAVVNRGSEPLVCVACADAEHDPTDVFPFPVWPPLGTDRTKGIPQSVARPAEIRNLAPEAVRMRSTCRACGGDRLIRFLSLGELPLANSFLSSEQLRQPELRLPLEVYFCSDCHLVQLLHVVNREILFGEYIYRTGTNQTIARHNAALAQEVVRKLGLSSDSLVLEVGSNDGGLLQCFRQLGVRILGVEPARNIAQLAREAGIETINEFFDARSAAEIGRRRGLADVVIANNVLAHVDSPVEFLAACKSLLKPQGRVLYEAPYLLDLLERMAYDTIYHEHLCYFAVEPLVRLFTEAGLTLDHVDRTEIHGGSLRMWGKHADDSGPDESVQKLCAMERQAGLNRLETYQAFARRVERNRGRLRELLSSLKSEGKIVVGYGAPAKGNTLLCYCGIGTDWVRYTTDRSILKIGLYTPGSHIPVKPVEQIWREQPDYILILPWNFAAEIMENLSAFTQKGGRFILPIPEPEIVGERQIA
jgi:dTDP-4-dehydrorhamnose 3,5-epimerase-like enzyme/SAM-dependent methyltransferase